MSTPEMSETITHGVRVSATPVYLAEQSDPDQRRYMFNYTIDIANTGKKPMQLVSRHWIIIDAYGRREDVNGPGVVGQTPRLEPGDSFKYQSFCPLRTVWGTMEGSYQMRYDNGETFDVQIPRFFLKIPKEEE